MCRDGLLKLAMKFSRGMKLFHHLVAIQRNAGLVSSQQKFYFSLQSPLEREMPLLNGDHCICLLENITFINISDKLTAADQKHQYTNITIYKYGCRYSFFKLSIAVPYKPFKTVKTYI